VKKLLKPTWTSISIVAGVLALRLHETLAAALRLPPDSGPWIMIAVGIALLALAIVPYIFFR
jgi:hypothetical protein